MSGRDIACPKPDGARREPGLARIDAAMDRAYYLRSVGTELADPALHFHTAGWKLGHNPNAWFDCAWYLRRYPDIAEAGIDPFLHFLGHGAAEGRAARPATGHDAATLAGAIAPADRRPGYDAPADARHLTDDALRAALAHALQGSAGLVVSVSHDRYVDVTGGMQVLIAAEQALFQAGRVTYLHISPAVSRLTLGHRDEGAGLLQLVLDGRFLGLAADAMLTAALDRTQVARPLPRVLAVHSVFGHGADALVALAAALRPQHSYFWLHDYASLCEGFNLLRNELAFCHAPPADSMACRVCVHGDSRPSYLAELRTLFEAVAFHVVAPSRAALDIWLGATDLPWQTARVHDNARLGDPRAVPPRGARGTRANPVRVAFAGYPMSHKGWPAFLDLLRAAGFMAGYRFHHFAAPGTLPASDALVSVATRVTAADPDAMIRALEAHQIDLLLMLSPWPETFSYVAHEGLAAGCDLVALEVGGNLPELVRGQDRGVVLADTAGVLAYFTSGEAVAGVRAREAAGRFGCDLLASGTSATLDPAALQPAGLALDITGDPGLVVLADGRALTVTGAGHWLRAALPPGADIIRLRSRRQLRDAATASAGGLMLEAVILDGAVMVAGDVRRLDGWQDAADGGQLTNGDATLRAAGATLLELRLNPSGRYRTAPMTQPAPAFPAVVTVRSLHPLPEPAVPDPAWVG